MKAKPAWRSWQFYLIVLGPLLPIVLATLYFYSGSAAEIGSSKNQGTLVAGNPSLEGLLTPPGVAYSFVIAVVGGEECGQACRRKLALAQRNRAALGRDLDKVELVYINLDRQSPFGLDEFGVDRVVTIEEELLASRIGRQFWSGWFPGGRALILSREARVVLAYSDKDPVRSMVKDLKVLIRHD